MAEMEEEQERAAQRAEELQEELRADAERRQIEQEMFQKARGRAMSDATEMPPPSEDLTDVTPVETFQEEIQWQGASFMSVKLFHPQKGKCYIQYRDISEPEFCTQNASGLYGKLIL